MGAEESYLREDLRIIQETPIDIEYLNDDLVIIQKLDDEPNDVGGLSSGELKERFDKAGLIIKDYLNGKLIPAVLASNATEVTREASENERIANEEGRVEAEAARVEAENRRVSETEGIVARTVNAIENMEARAHGLIPGANAEVIKSVRDDVVHLDFGIPAGESGVYVGRGTPPEWCKIQIDPDGVPSAAGDMVTNVYDPQKKQKPVAFADELATTNSNVNNKQNKITVYGILKGNGTTISKAVAGTDYQAPLTFDTTPTQGSSNPVTSGGVYEAITSAIQGAIGGAY